MRRHPLWFYIFFNFVLCAATPPVQIQPAKASVRAGAAKTFTAMLTGVSGPVTWSVVGGNSFGTITQAGVYTAPAANPGAITVRATVATGTNTTASSDAAVTWLNPEPAITSLSPSSVNVGTFTIAINGTGFLASSQVKLNGTAVTAQFIPRSASKPRLRPLVP